MDVNGKLFHQFEVEANQEKRISVTDLSLGVYFVVDQTTGVSAKFVKN